MEPAGLMPHSQGHSDNPILSRINPIPRIGTDLFKIRSNTIFPSTPKPSKMSLSKHLKAFLAYSIVAK